MDLEPGGWWIHLELWVPCGGHTTYMWISLSIDDIMYSNDVPVFYTKFSLINRPPYFIKIFQGRQP